jgi:predicted nucleic acid-binding protein
MSLLLDTNVLSEIRKGARCHPAVHAWFERVADEEIHLSVLVVGELRRGIEAIRVRDSRAAQSLDRWLRRLLSDFGERLLPVDENVADEWGRMNAAAPRSAVDSLLAATAKVHGLTLVTRNVRHVKGLGVSYFDPFSGAAGN